MDSNHPPRMIWLHLPVFGLLFLAACSKQAPPQQALLLPPNQNQTGTPVEFYVTNELTSHDFDGYWTEEFTERQSALLPVSGIIWKRWSPSKQKELFEHRKNLGIFALTYYWKVAFLDSRVTAIPDEEDKVAWDHEVAFEVSEKKTALDVKMISDAQVLLREYIKTNSGSEANLQAYRNYLFSELLKSGKYSKPQVERATLETIQMERKATEPQRRK